MLSASSQQIYLLFKQNVKNEIPNGLRIYFNEHTYDVYISFFCLLYIERQIQNKGYL